MKANELRIGNWLNDFAGEPHQVIHLTKDKTILETPIRLTEEWLLKFDWYEITSDGRYVFRDNEYYSIGESGSLYFDAQDTATDVQYVHQLQNLYFDLTGNELTIK